MAVIIAGGVAWAQLDTTILPDITLAAHSNASNWAAMSPDGLLLATCGDDGAVKIWKYEDFSLLKTLSTPSIKKEAAEFFPNDEFIAEAGANGKVNIRKAANAFSLTRVLTASGPVTGLALSPDGAYLAAASGKTIKLWRMKDYFLRELRGPGDEILAIAIGADSRFLVCASADQYVYVYNLTNKQLAAKYHEEAYPCTAIAISGDSVDIAYGDYTGRLTIRNRETQSIIRTFIAHPRYVSACAVSPDNKYLVSASMAGDIKIWKVGVFGLLKTLQGQSGGVLHLSFTTDGQYLISSGGDGTIQFWDLNRILARGSL